MTPAQRTALYRKGIEAYGAEAQIGMVHEEIGELLVAVGHWRRKRATRGDVLVEIADVRVMLEQLEIMAGFEVGDADALMHAKLERHAARIDAHIASGAKEMK